jgi:hypothetical protein
LLKIFEKIIQKILNKWLNENNIITPYQSGLIKRKQTNDHLFKLTQSTLEGFIWNYKTGALQIDIEKAFDKGWHSGLLYKMNQAKIPNYLGLRIQSYLTNRSFRVRCGNTLSSNCKIEARVPQGSVLGPTLFDIF